MRGARRVSLPRKAWALLPDGGADPELGFEPMEKVEQLGPSGSGLLGTGVGDAWV